jgi:hypothetical protein
MVIGLRPQSREKRFCRRAPTLEGPAGDKPGGFQAFPVGGLCVAGGGLRFPGRHFSKDWRTWTFEGNQSNLRLISLKVSGRSFQSRFFCHVAGSGRVDEKTTH